MEEKARGNPEKLKEAVLSGQMNPADAYRKI